MTQLRQSVTANLPARPEFYGPRLERALLDAGVAEGASWDRAARPLIDLARESGFSSHTRGSGEQLTSSFSFHGGRFKYVAWAFEVARGAATRSGLR